MSDLAKILMALAMAVALSIDAFATGFAYGADEIKIPQKSIWVITVICSAVLGISLAAGTWIGNYIPVNITKYICIVILIILSLIKFFESYLKSLIKKRHNISRNMEFSLFSLKVTLHLYASPEDADFDRSKEISVKEAVALALALSLDSLTIGFGTGMNQILWWEIMLIIFLSLVFGVLSLGGSCFLGNKIAKKTNVNLSWISGLILLLLAICKIFI